MRATPPPPPPHCPVCGCYVARNESGWQAQWHQDCESEARYRGVLERLRCVPPEKRPRVEQTSSALARRAIRRLRAEARLPVLTGRELAG